MPESEMTGSKLEWRVGENVARPRTTKSRKQDRIDPVIFVNRFFRLDDRRIRWRRRWIVTAGHVHIDVAESFFRQLRFQSSERVWRGLVRHKTKIEFGDR